MSRVSRIIEEIKELESKINMLKRELKDLQSACEHHYISNQLMRTCSKCRLSESIYY